MKYLLHLSYKGTRYRGYQRQPNVVTVQQTIEDTIIKFIKEDIHIVGCGRTDAGVHASNYVAHMVTDKTLSDDFVFIINKMLPHDIVIHSVEEVDRNVQAQYHVKSRRYDYFIHLNSDPLLDELSTLYSGPELDFTLMNTAISLLVGKHNFKGFCKQPDTYDHTHCIMYDAAIYQKGDRYQVRFEADRFLRSMVRLLVGNLIAVGQGQLSIPDWIDILSLINPAQDYNLAHPQGLYLSGVRYPNREYTLESFLSFS